LEPARWDTQLRLRSARGSFSTAVGNGSKLANSQRIRQSGKEPLPIPTFGSLDHGSSLSTSPGETAGVWWCLDQWHWLNMRCGPRGSQRWFQKPKSEGYPVARGYLRQVWNGQHDFWITRHTHFLVQEGPKMSTYCGDPIQSPACWNSSIWVQNPNFTVTGRILRVEHILMNIFEYIWYDFFLSNLGMMIQIDMFFDGWNQQARDLKYEGAQATCWKHAEPGLHVALRQPQKGSVMPSRSSRSLPFFLGGAKHQWEFQDPIDWRYLPYIRPI
jgi:hypothetical protein